MKRFKTAIFICLIFCISPLKAAMLDFEDPENLGVTLGGHLQWNGTGGGHLFCNSYLDDDYLFFDSPTYLNSFQMHSRPFDDGSPGTGNAIIDVAAFDSNNSRIWEATVDLSNYWRDWHSDWYTVSVEKGDIAGLIFYAPGLAPHYSYFWPSIDRMIINEDIPSPVPLPSTIILLTCGLLGVLWLKK